MRRGTIEKCALLLAGVLLTGSLSVRPVYAGTSALVVDEASYKEGLDTTLWNNPNEDIEIQDGSMYFSKNSTDETILITRTIAKKNEYCKNMVSAEAKMQFLTLPEGQEFIMAFGLSSVEAISEEPGNVEVAFTNAGGLKASVIVYDENGEAKVLVDSVSCGRVGSTINVKAEISTESELTLTVGSKSIFKGELPVSAEGRVGFLQSGGCEVRLSDVEVVCYEYDRPENCNVYEDFEQGSINSSVLTAKHVVPNYDYTPTTTYIDNMGDNSVFRFENVGVSYIGSTYKYSNFELIFDVVDLQRENECNEEGEIIKPKCDSFAVSYGDEAADYNTHGYVTSPDILVFSGSRVYSTYGEGYGDAAEKGYPFSDPECDRDFTLRVSMKDSVVTVGVKWIEEEEFTDFFTYQISDRTPTGYVHIWTPANVANFAIDNLQIINTDMDPNVKEVEFQSAVIKPQADYEYEPVTYEYAKKAVDTSFNPYMILPVVALLCILTFVIATVRKNKSRKAGGADEKQ